MCGIIVSDEEYPKLVAHQLLSKICDEFLAKYPRTAFTNATENTLTFPELKDYIVKYQDPQQADSIMKIQKELDETKIVLHKTIESVLERGEKIDNLVAKSDGLSAQSKMFYTQVRLCVSGWARLCLLTLSSRPRSRTLAAPLCDHDRDNVGHCSTTALGCLVDELRAFCIPYEHTDATIAIRFLMTCLLTDREALRRAGYELMSHLAPLPPTYISASSREERNKTALIARSRPSSQD